MKLGIRKKICCTIVGALIVNGHETSYKQERNANVFVYRYTCRRVKVVGSGIYKIVILNHHTCER